MTSDATVKIVTHLPEVNGPAWDPARYNPFVSHAFLKALEDAGTVGPKTGWMPRHLVLEDEAGGVAGVAPAYVKSHSQGEFVFDHGWAEAYMQAGGRY